MFFILLCIVFTSCMYAVLLLFYLYLGIALCCCFPFWVFGAGQNEIAGFHTKLLSICLYLLFRCCFLHSISESEWRGTNTGWLTPGHDSQSKWNAPMNMFLCVRTQRNTFDRPDTKKHFGPGHDWGQFPRMGIKSIRPRVFLCVRTQRNTNRTQRSTSAQRGLLAAGGGNYEKNNFVLRKC